MTMPQNGGPEAPRSAPPPVAWNDAQKDRTARTNLAVIQSEVHQMFGRYTGQAVTDSGEVLRIENLIGFAEEHHARW